MQVQSIKPIYGIQTRKTVNSKNFSTFRMPLDSVSFGNVSSHYQDVLKETVLTTFKKDIEVEKAFNKIITSLDDDKTIEKLKPFEFLSDFYEKNGLRELLRELWTPNPKPETKLFLNGLPNEIMPLVNKDGNPVVEIFKMGPQRLWDFVINKKNPKRDVALIFTSADKKYYGLTLGLNSKGGYKLGQYIDDANKVTEYYPSTGNRAVVTDMRYNQSYSTYYNQDGKEDFFKNVLFGGIPLLNLK